MARFPANPLKRTILLVLLGGWSGFRRRGRGGSLCRRRWRGSGFRCRRRRRRRFRRCSCRTTRSFLRRRRSGRLFLALLFRATSNECGKCRNRQNGRRLCHRFHLYPPTFLMHAGAGQVSRHTFGRPPAHFGQPRVEKLVAGRQLGLQNIAQTLRYPDDKQQHTTFASGASKAGGVLINFEINHLSSGNWP